ncbi:hypothetical protein CDD81_2821 [Ophiocordyceps australis]|uniref:Uncharacterized protein n=1 Tax=Ophiocordyceps australis TaxID=1399860 RepID=A0A2C5X7F9_9HYPO|nr:hypothetical protein CDD81_2821 [Ophiocordyceps australis]
MLKVAVIGGGPAGLATLKFLATAHHFFPIPPVEARLFEAECQIGGTFLVSSKYLTAFSDFRLPLDAPDFVTPQVYVQYLMDYVARFELEPMIECQAKVTRVSRGEGGLGHLVQVSKPSGQCFDFVCDAVAICSGINVNPIIPKIEGINRVATVLHSSKLKKRQQFGQGTHVVVCGAGETGMDIAHLAVTSPTASVTLCHRDGFFCAPKIIPTPVHRSQKGAVRPNKPVDASVASLFDTAYAHPVLQRSQLLWTAYDQWVKKMHLAVSGTEEGPDQWVGQISRERKYLDSIFLCKSDKALPYISEGHRSQSLWNRMRSSLLNVPIKKTFGRRIHVRKWPTKIDKHGWMHFADSDVKCVRPNVIVFATGYKSQFDFLDADYPLLGQADVRGIYKTDHVSVGYIGFVRPSIGAIPPLAELQAQLWVLRLLQASFPSQVPQTPGPNAVEAYQLDYALHARQGYDFFANKRGVDHESYAYQLALDMGSAPTISYVATKGWKLFFTWAMGSNFNPKFRLVGPWRDEACAEHVMRGELYGVVKRSGGFIYLVTYSIIPMIIFGLLSILLYAVTGIKAAFVSAVGTPASKVPRLFKSSKTRF